MIDRINFIEKEPIRLTYGIILKAAGGLLVLCVIIYGFQFGRSLYYEKKRANISVVVDELRNTRRLLLEKYAPKAQEGPLADIKNVFINTPPWAQLIEDLGVRLPSTVWLTEIRGAASRLPSESPPPADVVPSVNKQTEGSLVIQGIARREDDVALLMTNLHRSPFASNVVLEKSEKSGSDFTFVIKCDMVVPH